MDPLRQCAAVRGSEESSIKKMGSVEENDLLRPSGFLRKPCGESADIVTESSRLRPSDASPKTDKDFANIVDARKIQTRCRNPFVSICKGHPQCPEIKHRESYDHPYLDTHVCEAKHCDQHMPNLCRQHLEDPRKYMF